MNIQKFFKDNHEAYSKFEDVQNKLSNRPDLNAFMLLDKLVPSTHDIISASEHDEFFLDVDMELLAKVANENDLLDLIRCGVRYSEYDCLCMFS